MDIYASKLSPALDIGTGVFLLVTAAFSIVGNMLVLIMAFKRSSSMKPPELLSVNLALTDLGAAVSMYPLAVASAWSHRWLGGDATCLYYGLAGFFFGVASIMNLTIIAIVRFIVSLSLQSPNEKISRRNVKLLCAWTWLYALLWALCPILGWGRYGPEPFGLSCSLAWGQMKNEGYSFVISMFSFNLVMPSTIIIFCYLGIVVKLFCVYKKTHNSHQIPNVVKMHRRLLIAIRNIAGAHNMMLLCLKEKFIQKSNLFGLLQIAFLISLGFIGCWAPYGIVSLWSIFKDSASIPPEVSLLPCMFAKTSTMYNPFIYYAFSKTFKGEVKKLGRICGGSNACHASNNITDEGIYMVSNEKKAKEARPNEVYSAFEVSRETVGQEKA